MSITILSIISPGLAEFVELKQIMPGQTVEFRLTRAGMIDPTSTRKVSTPQYQGLAPYCNIKDPFDKNVQEKTIMNITGYDAIKGKPGEPTYMDPRVDFVRFLETGSIICTSEMNNLYYFLKLHNKNRDNPNRKTDAPVLFYEVDVKKEIKVKNNGFDYRVLASNLLFQAEEDRIVEIAAKLQRAYPKKYSFDIKDDVEKLKANLISVAESASVDFILAVKEPISLTRVLIEDAIERKHIFFDDHEEKLAWKWKRQAGKPGKHEIVKLEKGNNPVRALVEFLNTANGNEHLVEVKELYEGYYSAKVK